MVVWHHRLDGHGFQQPPGDGEGHGKPWRAAVHGVQMVGHALVMERNRIWRTLKHGCKLRRKAMAHGCSSSKFSITDLLDKCR